MRVTFDKWGWMETVVHGMRFSGFRSTKAMVAALGTAGLLFGAIRIFGFDDRSQFERLTERISVQLQDSSKKRRRHI